MDATQASRYFRQFVQELEAEGEILRIQKEVDPDAELAAITRRVYETGSPAPLFINIKGRNGNDLFDILGAPVGLSSNPSQPYCRIAKSLGLPSSASAQDLMDKLIEARKAPPIKSVAVKDAPVKKNIIQQDRIDLTSLPVPMHHPHDGGKYIASTGMHIVQSPDGRWVNWSITRAMINDKKTLVGAFLPGQDITTILELWRAQGKDMPWALAFGVPPAALMASGMPLPKWVDESGYIGAVTGHPVEVIKAETNDLMVPAFAELVFEGVVSISKTAPEGPMGEYHGMMFPGKANDQPIFEVNAITYRKDPILPISVAGRAPDETHTVWGIAVAAEVLVLCREAGLPIKMSWSPFESHVCWCILQVDRPRLLAMHTTPEQFCRRVGEVVFGSKPGAFVPKIFLVGEDVDPTNLADVIWAESVRCEPGRCDFVFEDRFPTVKILPYVAYGSIPKGKKPSQVVKCCMLPSEFEDEKLPFGTVSFAGLWPKAVQKQVMDSWTAYGFPTIRA